jgi:sulfonate transport system permease protein
VIPLLLLAALELCTRSSRRRQRRLAPPSAALQAWWGRCATGRLWQATAFTLGTAAAGLALGARPGRAAGTLLGLSRRAAAAGFLSIELLRPVPSVALIPLAMLVFGFGLRMEAAVVAFATLWPVLVLTQAAVRQVEPQLLEVSAALELSAWQRARWVVLPAMLPRLFVALRLAVAIALVVAVTVEIAANPHGMGYAMMIAQQSLDPALMLGWLLWIGVVGWTPSTPPRCAAAGRGAPHGGGCVTLRRCRTSPRRWRCWRCCSACGGWRRMPVGQPRLPAHARGGSGRLAGLQQGDLAAHTAATVGRMLAGWGLASLLGVALGALIGSSAMAREPGCSRCFEFLRPLPASAVLPLAIALFGLSSGMVLAVVAFGAMWPVLLATLHGFASVHERLREVAAALQLSRTRLRLQARAAQGAARHPGRAAAVDDGVADRVGGRRDDRVAARAGAGHPAGGTVVPGQRPVRRRAAAGRGGLRQQCGAGAGRAPPAALAAQLSDSQPVAISAIGSRMRARARRHVSR